MHMKNNYYIYIYKYNHQWRKNMRKNRNVVAHMKLAYYNLEKEMNEKQNIKYR